MVEERAELLLAMSIAAREEALERLSEAGREVLQMMGYTSRNAGLPIAEAYVEASATAELSEQDIDIIKVYLARRTLIEAFDEDAEGEE